MTEYVKTRINNRYPIVLPDFRRDFHEARPNWEAGRLESCDELMQPGMIVYDVGAEHGDFTALYRKWVGDSGDVIPIEPAAHYWEFIKGTWEANGFSQPPSLSFAGLIGDEDFAVGDYVKGWPTETSTKGIPDGGFSHLRYAKGKDPLTTIDHLAHHVRPDAIVLDIEGAEWNALHGAQYTLAEFRPIIWVSVHDVDDGAGWPGPLQGWYKKTLQDIHDLMSHYNYYAMELPHLGEGEHFYLYRPQ